MQSRVFWTGVLVGVVLCLLIQALVRQADSSAAGDMVETELAPAPGGNSPDHAVPVVPQTTTPSGTAANEGRAGTVEDGPDEQSTQNEWPESTRARVMDEPKDDAWAWNMEQAILQFLAAHGQSGNYEIARIECRTTACLIEVHPFTEAAAPAWPVVMYDMTQQPWYGFGEAANSTGEADGRLLIVQTLKRRRGP